MATATAFRKEISEDARSDDHASIRDMPTNTGQTRLMLTTVLARPRL